MTDVEPAGTDTVAGTVSLAALLERLIVAPPVGAALDNVTEHVAASPWFKLTGEHETRLTIVLAMSAMEAEAELEL